MGLRVRCELDGVLPQYEGLLVVESVSAGDEQVAVLLLDGLVLHILVEIECLVGEEPGMFKRHGKVKQTSRERSL